MKILSPKQLKEADEHTIKFENITSWELMERASLRAVEQILKITDKTQIVSVLAGSGNNGGDGLAIAYHLIQHDYEVNIYLLKYNDDLSPDCHKNLERIHNEKSCKVTIFNSQTNNINIKANDVIIDAVFGIGLNRDLPKFVEEILKYANEYNAIKIAIDVPSGLFLSQLTPKNAIVFQADFTLTFQCPKLNFFLPDYGNCVGKVLVIDIGLEKNFISNLDYNKHYIDDDYAFKLLKTRQRFTHKGHYGHLLIIGGQYGMMGSVCLTTKAAFNSGVGKVSVLSPKCGVEILQNTIPEAMVIPSKNNEFITPVKFESNYTTICIGMGLGLNKAAVDTVEFAITHAKTPMVIDADALNILSKNKILLKKLPSKSILTPHQGELKRLIGEWKDDYDKIQKIKRFTQKYDVILVSKDAYTFVFYYDKFYINSTGNAGMATAGSGDTLSGIISSLLAQNYTPLEASLLGVYLHGKAADLYVQDYDEYSLTASDIIEFLKKAFVYLNN